MAGRPKRTTKKRQYKKKQKTKNKKVTIPSQSQLRNKLEVLSKQRIADKSPLESASTPSASNQVTDDSVYQPSAEPTSAESTVSVGDVEPVLHHKEPLVESGTTDDNVSIPLPVQGVGKKKFGPFCNKSLSAIHNQMVGLEVRFQRDVFELEGIYTERYYKPLQELRRKLLQYNCSGQLYSTEYWNELVDSCSSAFPVQSTDFSQLRVNVNNMLLHLDTNMENYKSYWLSVLLNSDPMVSDLIYPKDIDKLKYVTEIRSLPLEVFRKSEESLTSISDSGIGFEVRFEFRKNPYFSNQSLCKRYVIDILPSPADYVTTYRSRDKVDSDDCDSEDEASESEIKKSGKHTEPLLDYKGPRVVSVKGCDIEWNSTDSESECIGTLSSEDAEPSFFDYFTTEWEGSRPDNSCSTSEVLRDYEIGTYFRDVLIPRSYALYRKTKGRKCADESVKTLADTATESTSFDTEPNMADVEPHEPKTSNTMTDKTEHLTTNQSSVVQPSKPTQNTGKQTNQNFDHEKNEDKHEWLKTSPRQRRLKPTFKVSYSEVADTNYDRVDEEVVLRRTKIPAPSRKCDVDDYIEPYSGSLAVSSGIHNRFQRDQDPSRYFDASNPTEPCCEGNGCQSVEQSRQEMACVVDKVNKLLEFADKSEFPNVSVDEVLAQDAKERAIKLSHRKRVRYESDVGFSDGFHSLVGEEADDEDALSEIQPPSVNRAFERIKYNMKISANTRKRKCYPVPDDSSGSACTTVPSEPEKRVRYRDVSAYPVADDNPCDDSDDVISSKEGESPCLDDVCRGRNQPNQETPSSTDTEGSDHTRKSLERARNRNAVLEAPLVSSRVEARAKDTDSEAPPTPKEGETPNCKQQ